MKVFFAVLGGIVGFFALVFVVGFVAEGQDFMLYKFFAPKQEAVRRQVFENTKSYNQGMAQEIRNYQIEYIKTKDPQQKSMLASAILHQVADYPMEKFPTDLQQFVQELRDKQTIGQ